MLNIVVATQAYSLNCVKLLLGNIFNLVKSQEKNLPEILMISNKYEDRTVVSGEAVNCIYNSLAFEDVVEMLRYIVQRSCYKR